MAMITTALPYGLRDVKITPFTTAASTTIGTPIDLPNGQTFSFSESEDFEELRGDDGLVAVRGKGPAIEWDLESGGISLAAYAAIAGGTVTETGVSPNAVRRYRKLKDDVRPYFRAQGQSISDSGGDFHTIVYRARATGDLSTEQKDGAFMVPSVSGTGLPSLETASLGALYDFLQNETATPIVAP